MLGLNKTGNKHYRLLQYKAVSTILHCVIEVLFLE
jgi:hypothetical protein